MKFPLIKNTTRSSKLLIFMLLLVFGLVFSSIVSVFVGVSGDNGLAAVVNLQIAQIISQVVGLLLPPLIYVCLVQEKPFKYLGFKQLPLWSLLGIVTMLTILPFNTMVAEWNESFEFPTIIKKMQEAATAISEKMMNEGNLIVNLLIFGALAAVSEELLFRSVIQKAFLKIIRNPHVAIIVTAVLFSAFHMEFYGFFPRFILGLMLGYMFWLSDSIWSTILMHFVNNATIVMLYYLNTRGFINIDVEHFGNTDNVLVILLSLITTVAIFWTCNRLNKRHFDRPEGAEKSPSIQ